MRLGEKFTEQVACPFARDHAAVVEVKQMTRYRRRWLDCHVCKKSQACALERTEADDAPPKRQKPSGRKAREGSENG